MAGDGGVGLADDERHRRRQSARLHHGHGGPCRFPNFMLHALLGGAGATTLSISPDGSLTRWRLPRRTQHDLVHEPSGRRRLLAHAHHRTIRAVLVGGRREAVSASADGTSGGRWPAPAP